MLDYLTTDHCRMRFLRDQLDDPEAVDCGRCDNCGGLALSTEVSAAAVEEAEPAAVPPGVPVGPAQDVAVRAGHPRYRPQAARSPTGADEGRVVARLTDLGLRRSAARAVPRRHRRTGRSRTGWRARWSSCSRTGSPRSTRSSWSSPRPGRTLTADLAAGLSRYLSVPVVGTWAIVDPDVAPGRGQANSAQRVAAVGRRCVLHADDPGRARVLLVDDLVVTGWTLTLAARSRSARRVRPPCCRWPWPARHSTSAIEAIS